MILPSLSSRLHFYPHFLKTKPSFTLLLTPSVHSRINETKNKETLDNMGKDSNALYLFLLFPCTHPTFPITRSIPLSHSSPNPSVSAGGVCEEPGVRGMWPCDSCARSRPAWLGAWPHNTCGRAVDLHWVCSDGDLVGVAKQRRGEGPPTPRLVALMMPPAGKAR